MTEIYRAAGSSHRVASPRGMSCSRDRAARTILSPLSFMGHDLFRRGPWVRVPAGSLHYHGLEPTILGDSQRTEEIVMGFWTKRAISSS